MIWQVIVISVWNSWQTLFNENMKCIKLLYSPFVKRKKLNFSSCIQVYCIIYYIYNQETKSIYASCWQWSIAPTWDKCRFEYFEMLYCLPEGLVGSLLKQNRTVTCYSQMPADWMRTVCLWLQKFIYLYFNKILHYNLYT